MMGPWGASLCQEVIEDLKRVRVFWALNLINRANNYKDTACVCEKTCVVFDGREITMLSLCCATRLQVASSLPLSSLFYFRSTPYASNGNAQQHYQHRFSGQRPCLVAGHSTSEPWRSWYQECGSSCPLCLFGIC